jgi:hypothetical protein
MTTIGSSSMKPASGGSLTLERGTLKLFAKYPPHNNYFCSYEVFLESPIFNPDSGRSAMIYVMTDLAIEKSYFDYGRFCFFIQKSLQPVVDEALTNKSLQLSVQFLVEGNRPFRDQTEAVFQLKVRDNTTGQPTIR